MAMPPITVREVTADNWLAAIALRVHPAQECFVPSVAISLAKAYIKPDGEHYEPFAVYAAGAMVGFYSVVYRPQQMTRCYLAGLLIDHTYQGRGYGTAVVSHVLDVVPRTYPACEAIGLTVYPENMVATRLYQRFGFSKTGVVIDGEDAMWLTVPHHVSEC